MTAEVISCIEGVLGRTLSEEVKNSEITLYQAGFTSYELVQIIVKLEELYEVEMDDVLERLNDLTVNDLDSVLSELV